MDGLHAAVDAAGRDDLTGLPNRSSLRSHLENTLLNARQRQSSCALLFADLDGFKEVNGTFGHHAGDQLLLEVARRFNSVLRESDVLARLGGDEFAVVSPASDLTDAVALADQLLRALDDPFAIHGHAVHVSASVGIALGPGQGRDAQTLMRHADVAMYVAKRSGSGPAVYSPAEDPYSPRILEVAADLRRALENGELLVHYQPIVDMRTGACARAETLLRWQHPRRGLVPPEQFVSLAESSGLTKALGSWVLGRALRDCAAWAAADLRLGVAVNLSTRHLRDPALAASIAQLLEGARVPADRLTLEITETAVATDHTPVIHNFARLRRLGVRLAIDDFGTAYSSLSVLRGLSVDEIKIDNSFVLSLTSDESSAAIARATIQLAHNLGLAVVAEGVEDQRTWDLLAAMGCDAAQGYHVSRSMPPDVLGRWLEERRSLATANDGQKRDTATRLLRALTPREREVLRLMGEGLENEEIAARLGVTLVTVRGYAQKVLEKLDAHSRLEAVVRAGKCGLLQLLEPS